MSVQLTGFMGYYSRQGVIIGEFNRAAGLYGAALTGGFQSIWQQFASGDQSAVTTLPGAVNTYQQSAGGYLGTLTSCGQSQIQLQVNDDTPLTTFSVPAAIGVLTTQMKANGQSINRPTTTITITPSGTNKGDAHFFGSLTNQYGDPLDCVYTETITATCTSPSPPFGEQFTVLGTPAVPKTQWNWPQGSGCNQSVAVTNPVGATLLTDGAFANWTGAGNNTPVNWSINTAGGGTAANVSQGTGGVRSTNPTTLLITSDGSSPTQIFQQMQLATNTVIAVSIQAKMSALDGTGILRIALCNSSGSVITDDAGNNLSKTFGLNAGSGIGTSYTPVCAFFDTPRQIPAGGVFVYIGYSTAPANTKVLTLDLAAGVNATQLYAQGPYVAAFSGSAASAQGDFVTIAVTNSLGTQSFARGSQRAMNLDVLGPKVYYPSSVSPTIPDSLVTSP